MVCIIGGTDLIPEKIPILRRGLAYRGEKTTTISLRTSRVFHLEILRSNMLSTNKYRSLIQRGGEAKIFEPVCSCSSSRFAYFLHAFFPSTSFPSHSFVFHSRLILDDRRIRPFPRLERWKASLGASIVTLRRTFCSSLE